MTSYTTSYNHSTATLVAAELERRRRERAARVPLFRGAALEVQTITSPEWIISGAAETGKTFAMLYFLHMTLSKYPKARATLLRKVRATVYGTVLETWKRVIEFGDERPYPYGGVNPSMYIYPNGSRLWIGGMDNPGKILSAERDIIAVNQAEELDSKAWEYILTRTTGRGAVVPHPMTIGDCNPSSPEHWILQRHQAGHLKLLRSYHQDNPTLHDGRDWTAQGRRTLDTLSNLTGSRQARLFAGEWVADDGEEAFLPSIAMWDSCQAAIPALTGEQPMVIALDAAVSGDTFALVGVTRHPDNSDAVIVREVRIWEPSGEALDYASIEAEIRALIRDYNVVQVNYDPYQLHYLSQRLSDVVWCKAFNQGADRLEADANLRALIIQRRLFHDGAFAGLRAHIGNADAKMDETGHKLRMVKRHANAKIDAAVALSMATYRALELNLY
jgi:hypothetical protein